MRGFPGREGSIDYDRSRKASQILTNLEPSSNLDEGVAVLYDKIWIPITLGREGRGIRLHSRILIYKNAVSLEPGLSTFPGSGLIPVINIYYILLLLLLLLINIENANHKREIERERGCMVPDIHNLYM